jgi:hypothetical protein
MTTFEEDSNGRLIITHTRANTLTFTADAVEDEVDINFAGYTAEMTFKRSENAANALSLTTGSGITLTTGLISVSATAAQMDLPDGAYYFDLTMTVSGVVKTWFSGVLNIKSSFT